MRPHPERRLVFAAAIALVASGCVTRAQTRLGAVLDYARALQERDPVLHGAVIDAEKFEYVGPALAASRDKLTFDGEAEQDNLRGLFGAARLKLTSLHVDDAERSPQVDATYALDVVEPNAPGGSFKLSGRWRFTLVERGDAWKISRVEELPGEGQRARTATLALLKFLYGKGHLTRPADSTRGPCAKAQCQAVEYMDLTGRVIVTQVRRLTAGGVVEAEFLLDGSGQKLANYDR